MGRKNGVQTYVMGYGNRILTEWDIGTRYWQNGTDDCDIWLRMPTVWVMGAGWRQGWVGHAVREMGVAGLGWDPLMRAECAPYIRRAYMRNINRDEEMRAIGIYRLNHSTYGLASALVHTI